MAERRTSRQESLTQPPVRQRKQLESLLPRQRSALIGGSLIVLALLCFAWLIVHQLNPAATSVTFPFTSNATSTPSAPLAAAGVTLTLPAQGQEPTLTRQQALLLVSQIEPAVAAQSGGVDAQYTLFSYSSSGSSQISFHNVPVWLIHYSKVTEPHPDTSADPHASAENHDFYVFLNANNGQELLTIWL